MSSLIFGLFWAIAATELVRIGYWAPFPSASSLSALSLLIEAKSLLKSPALAASSWCAKPSKAGWAAKYTKNQVKFTAPPAFEGFAHQEEAAKAGLFNKDFASINNAKALRLLAEGNGAQYPILTNSVAAIAQNSPKMIDDIGYFAMPADNPAYTAATIWQPNALYLPRNTKC